MARVLYDLAAHDERLRFSPYCWRIRMALAHKGLDVQTVPWRFTDKDSIAFANTKVVPVLVDGDTVVSDSMAIANYLDERYPEAPLMGDAVARAHTVFVRHWVEASLFPLITRQIVAELLPQLHPQDRDYFRSTRERRLGMGLEAFAADRDGHRAQLHKALQPLRLTLASQLFMGGATPRFADYIVFAALQWARCGVGRVLVDADDPVHAWFDRLLQMHDGLGAQAPCATAST